MAIARLIGYNLGLSQIALQHLSVAALTHDIFTPAGGDSTKLLYPAMFDEDANYKDLFVTAGWKTLQGKYSFDEQLILQTVQGKLYFGQILDLADKLGYVSRDARLRAQRH